jgi:hypothetical protein
MLPEWKLFIKEIECKKENLQGADLGNKKLMGANLSGADLTDADLSICYLIKADLSNANLTNADMTGAVMSEAILKGANLEGAELEDAFLHGADLTDVINLTCDQLDLANFDNQTKFPKYIQIDWNSDKTFPLAARKGFIRVPVDLDVFREFSLIIKVCEVKLITSKINNVG